MVQPALRAAPFVSCLLLFAQPDFAEDASPRAGDRGEDSAASRPGEDIAVEMPVEGLTVLRGPVNGAWIEREGRAIAIYGDPRSSGARAEGGPPVDWVLFTHHRRDVVWAGRDLIRRGAKAVVPAVEAPLFSDVEAFWKAFMTKRFHDADQQTTKILREPMPVARSVRGGDTIDWGGITIRVLDTPGTTRGAVTYLLELGGKRIAFTGDLIWGDGRLLDLYSLQDAIPEAGIGGYHGYAARLGDLIPSLEKVLAEKPDLLVPARGPTISDPPAAAGALLGRIRKLYANYLSIDALRWYFKDDHILAKARRVLGPEAKVRWMPAAETIQETLPEWLVAIGNSRLILSRDGAGFLVDCGGDAIVRELDKLKAAGKLAAVEHVFITHYHADHTDRLARFLQETGATVHVSAEHRDVIENPGAHRLPVLTANSIHVSGRAASGDSWGWKEFRLTLWYFPGQTIYHDALLVEHEGGEKVFFIGDSFTPSGIDDYCLLNRNLLHEGKGYFFCLEHVRDHAPDALLVNQHVEPAFRYSRAQIDFMLATLRQRVELLRPLVPWSDPNFGLDEGWARLYPYAQRVRPGQTASISLRIFNHAPTETLYETALRLPAGWSLVRAHPSPIRIPSRQEGAVRFEFAVPSEAVAGLHVIGADIRWAEWDLRDWTESLVEVVAP